jgi:hypothetical protein
MSLTTPDHAASLPEHLKRLGVQNRPQRSRESNSVDELDDINFKIPGEKVMKKICLVLAVVILGSLAASATNINFSFDGYCDAIELTLTGTPKVYLDGVHDLSACGLPNTLIGGFAHTIPGYGSWLDTGDPLFGYLYGLPYGLELLSNANTKQSCIWAYYIDFAGGFDVIDNSGTCTYFKSALTRGNAAGLPRSFKKIQK